MSLQLLLLTFLISGTVKGTSLSNDFCFNFISHNSLLKNNGYKFKSRGKMQIKGKGQMTTYFLYGNTEREIPFEPLEQEANGLTILKGQ